MIKKVLFYDTETTGFIPKLPTKENVPHIVQMAATLEAVDTVTAEMTTMSKFSFLMQCPVRIPEGASNIHGIYNETVSIYGINPKLAILTLTDLISQADLIVAHNDAYDIPVINWSCIFHDLKAAITTSKATFCTMKATTDICKLPGRGGSFKWPKLQEAYKHFYGEEFKSAHDALADVEACRDVFKKLIEHKHFTF